MKRMQSSLLLWGLAAVLLFYPGLVSSQETPDIEETPDVEERPDIEMEMEMETELGSESIKIDLEEPSFQEVLEQLFGTMETSGLLEGDNPIVLHASDVTLTLEEAQDFFTPESPSDQDFAALIEAFEELKGGNIRIEGLLVDPLVVDSPFAFMIAGRQIKLDGLILTPEELDALVASLEELPGLHEAKIDAIVDGEPVSVKLQIKAEQVRNQGSNLGSEAEVLETSGTENQGRRGNRVERIEAATSNRGLERVERMERPEKPEKVERLERIERIERPEIARGRSGR